MRFVRCLLVTPPPEDHEHGKCGELAKSMYGTRDAASNWEDCYAEAFLGVGFRRGKAVSCIFENPEKDLRVTVHGDEFVIL